MHASRAQVASGHPDTTQAALDILRIGGNAFDAAIAAAWMACVVEPMLCSPGGGGHAMVRRVGRAPVVADFFTQTPRQRRIDGLEFYPIHGNFGPDVQEFHVGMGSVAVPGMVAGLFALHRRCGTLDMQALVAPAIDRARGGWRLNPTQARTLAILEPIVRATPEATRMFGLAGPDAALPASGDRIANPSLGDWLEHLAAEGPSLFYRGEVAAAIIDQSQRRGGHLTIDDLLGYRVRWRRPLRWRVGPLTLWSNPPPAFGGLMVALMTAALERQLAPGSSFGSAGHLNALVEAMRSSEADRIRLEQPECLGSERRLLQTYRSLHGELQVSRGTTHISVRDAQGNLVGLTASNGEGCGRVVADTGFMLNNMLGEEDLNRPGFHNWPRNRRLSSMMAPTLGLRNGDMLMLGSGGSNRIRTAIAQVLCNLMHFDFDLDRAVRAPRLHLEAGRLAMEFPHPDWPGGVGDWLERNFPEARTWDEPSLYFGGVHAVDSRSAVADPRRGGSAGGL